MTDETSREEPPAGGEAGAEGGRFRFWMLLPALGAAAVLAIFLVGLEQPNGGRDLPSALIGKPAPQFTLPPLYDGGKGLSTADLKGPGVKLVNVWASWCVPCRAEMAELGKLADMGITIYGINYKDRGAAAKAFLEELGNPFARIGADHSGRVGIDWGVYGVPETYVIDAKGRITYKKIGPIMEADIKKQILPAIEKAKAGG